LANDRNVETGRIYTLGLFHIFKAMISNGMFWMTTGHTLQKFRLYYR